MKKKIFITSLFFIFLLCGSAFSDDGELAHIAESRYFSVFAPKDFDINEFLTKLKYDHFLNVYNLYDKKDSNPKALLNKTLDALYLEASDALGIHVYSFHGSIYIYPDRYSLNAYLKTIFEMDLQEVSYYLHDKRTIYLSYPDITLGVMGHEIAHAIISNYFVVLPPAKVQEILSGYVEFNLRKQTKTLP